MSKLSFIEEDDDDVLSFLGKSDAPKKVLQQQPTQPTQPAKQLSETSILVYLPFLSHFFTIAISFCAGFIGTSFKLYPIPKIRCI